jgi:hypothetical protein
VDKDFNLSRRNEWWRKASAKYADVVDQFHFDELSVSAGLKLNFEANKELGPAPGVAIATQQQQA